MNEESDVFFTLSNVVRTDRRTEHRRDIKRHTETDRKTRNTCGTEAKEAKQDEREAAAYVQ